MPTLWEDYLSSAEDPRGYRGCHLSRADAFRPLCEVIRRVFLALEPDTVACLGAGVLNDIPYRALVRSGATIHLADWLPGAIDSGIACSVIGRDAGGAFECVYCRLADDRARAFCRHFERPEATPARVCAHFAAAAESPPRCQAFERGESPHVHEEDVTGGYAQAFGRRVLDELRDAASWRQALSRATALAKRVRRHRGSLEIADSSVDLVISSMLLSQFEHEPYDYFAGQAAALLGPPRANEERRLRPAIEALRATLLGHQIERHCDEIERLLAPGGRCFMAFETFHFDPELGRWFLVEEMHEALTRLAQRFAFTFDVIEDRDNVIRFESGAGRSMVACYLLAPFQDGHN